MRRILIELARHKQSIKRGGERVRVDLDGIAPVEEAPSENLLALDEALSELEQHDAQAAELVKLRYFGGLRHQEAAGIMGIERRQADRLWAVARTWLYSRLDGQ